MKLIVVFVLLISGCKVFAQASATNLVSRQIDTGYSTVSDEHDTVRTLHIVGKHGISRQSDHLGTVSLTNCQGDFNFLVNSIDTGLVLSGKGSRGELRFFGNNFTGDLGRVDIQDWTLEHMELWDNHYKELRMMCSRDTIRGSLVIYNMLPVGMFRNGSDTCDQFEIEFEDCYIDGAIQILKNGRSSQIAFEHCTFGPNTRYLSLMADDVTFENCSNPPAAASLQLYPNNDTCWLQLQHSNLGDASFIYGPGIHLAFDNHAPSDEYMSNYEMLLAKFRNEGKKESYQRLDIEYRQYKAAQGSGLDRIGDWLQARWWNYGYSRLRVVLWTLVLLWTFWMLNVVWWKGLQEVYPIPQEYPFIDRGTQPGRYQLQEALRIFLYTVYVFFSIKIDLSRLKMTNTWLLAYFFIQYLVGLWCLFFIVNALLKIG